MTVRVIALRPVELIKERLTHGHPPLYFIALKGWSSLFGSGERAMRSFSVLCGMLGLVYLFLIARRAWGGECAYWSLLFGAIHQELVYSSQDARPYGFLFLAAAASFHALMLALESGTIGAWALYCTWCIAGILVHVSFVFIFLGQALVLIAWQIRARRWRFDWALAAVPSFATMVLILALLKHFNQENILSRSSRWAAINELKNSPGLYVGGFDQGLGNFWDILAIFAIIGLIVCASRAARMEPRFAVRHPATAPLPFLPLSAAWAWSVPIGLALLSLVSGGTLIYSRYYAVGAGGGCLALALGMTYLKRLQFKLPLAAFCLATMVLITIHDQNQQGTGLRDAIQYLTPQLGTNEPIILRIAESSAVADYYDLEGPNVLIYSPEADSKVRDALTKAADSGVGFWLLKLNYGKEKFPMSASIAVVMRDRFNIESEKVFSHAHVWHYTASKSKK